MSDRGFRGDREQITALILAKVRKHGPELAETLPEIVDDARAGLSLQEIAEKYKIDERYKTGKKVAVSIVARAIQELIPDTAERQAIYQPRWLAGTKKSIAKVKAEGRGIFALTPEQNLANQRKAAAVSIERRVGIHAQDRYKLNDNGQIEIAEGTVRRPGSWFSGKLVDGLEEGNYVLSLLQNPEFAYPSGHPSGGTPDYTKITEAVNAKYGNNRSRIATKGFVDNVRARYIKKGKTGDKGEKLMSVRKYIDELK